MCASPATLSASWEPSYIGLTIRLQAKERKDGPMTNLTVWYIDGDVSHSSTLSAGSKGPRRLPTWPRHENIVGSSCGNRWMMSTRTNAAYF